MAKPPEAQDAPTDTAAAESDSVSFHYVKGNFFRVIHADGAWGGTTAKGFIQFSVYNERAALPRETVRRRVDGVWQKEDVVDTRGGVVREIEAEIIMDINTAISFHRWFAGQLEALRKSLGVPDVEWERAMTVADGQGGGDVKK